MNFGFQNSSRHMSRPSVMVQFSSNSKNICSYLSPFSYTNTNLHPCHTFSPIPTLKMTSGNDLIFEANGLSLVSGEPSSGDGNCLHGLGWSKGKNPVSSAGVLYSTVTIINNNVLYT